MGPGHMNTAWHSSVTGKCDARRALLRYRDYASFRACLGLLWLLRVTDWIRLGIRSTPTFETTRLLQAPVAKTEVTKARRLTLSGHCGRSLSMASSSKIKRE